MWEKDVLHKNLRKLIVIFLHDPPEFENFRLEKKIVEKIKIRALYPKQFSGTCFYSEVVMSQLNTYFSIRHLPSQDR